MRLMKNRNSHGTGSGKNLSSPVPQITLDVVRSPVCYFTRGILAAACFPSIAIHLNKVRETEFTTR